MNSLLSRTLRALAAGIVVFALSNATISMAQPQPAGSRALLRQAYITLSFANQDYQGHRYEAMREIEAAANNLNFDLRGDGTGGERQRVSNEQLRSARSLLEQARSELPRRPRRHVDKAIKQIDIALRIR